MGEPAAQDSADRAHVLGMAQARATAIVNDDPPSVPRWPDGSEMSIPTFLDKLSQLIVAVYDVPSTDIVCVIREPGAVTLLQLRVSEMSPDEARSVAAMLLRAADFAEGPS